MQQQGQGSSSAEAQPTTHPSVPKPPDKEEFISEDRRFDKAAKERFLDAKMDWFEKPGVKRAGETYSEEAYLRARRRAKRDPEDDNRKRRGRSSYGLTLSNKRDREYGHFT